MGKMSFNSAINDIVDELTLFSFNHFSFLTAHLSTNLRQRIDKDLIEARMNFNYYEYLPLCFLISLCVGFLLIPLIILSLNFVIIPLFVFIALFFGLLWYPKYRKKKTAKEIEKELSFALRSMGAELSINIPFEISLENISKLDYGLLSKEIKAVLRNVRYGASLPESLYEFGSTVDSLFVKRAVSQLINGYQKGGENFGNVLKKMADEYDLMIKNRIKEYNGKLVMYSLMFIATSVILPSLFQAVVTIGSAFLDISIDSTVFFIILLFVIPVINFLILVLVNFKKPW